MRLSWLFGNSIEAHHLLAAYVAVWLVQGGYAAWVAWQWKRVDKLLADQRLGGHPLADKDL